MREGLRILQDVAYYSVVHEVHGRGGSRGKCDMAGVRISDLAELCLISGLVTLCLLGNVMCEDHLENTLPLRRGQTYGDTVGKSKKRGGGWRSNTNQL